MIKVYRGSIQIVGTPDELFQDLADAIGGVKKHSGMAENLRHRLKRW